MMEYFSQLRGPKDSSLSLLHDPVSAHHSPGDSDQFLLSQCGQLASWFAGLFGATRPSSGSISAHRPGFSLSFLSLMLIGSASGSGIPSVIDLDEISAFEGLKIYGAEGCMEGEVYDCGDQIGISISGNGDVNGDGIPDLLIGAPKVDPEGKRNAGKAYLFWGGSHLAGLGAIDLASFPSNLGVVFSGEKACTSGQFQDCGDRFGTAVDLVGDLDKDGFDDFVVTADVRTGIHKSYIFWGKSDVDSLEIVNFNQTHGVILEGTLIRFCLSAVGDVNGDGFPDIALCDHSNLYLVWGGPDLRTEATLVLSSLAVGQGLRVTGLTAGGLYDKIAGGYDLNGDGIDDFVLSRPQRAAYQGEAIARAQSGVVFMFWGNASFSNFNMLDISELAEQQYVRFDGAASPDLTGYSLEVVGDIDGDGESEVLLAAPGANGGKDRAGVTYLLWGGNFTEPAVDLLNIGAEKGLILIGGLNLDIQGYSVGSAGDLNGDGLFDFITVSGRAMWNGANRPATRYLIWGSSDLRGRATLDLEVPSANEMTKIDGAVAGDLGRSSGNFQSASMLRPGPVGRLGDFNDDGIPDIFIGAYQDEPLSREHAGAVYVLWGWGQNLRFMSAKLSVSEGQSLTITEDDIQAFSPDAESTSLVFTVTSQARGHFATALSPSTPITSFTQADLDGRAIVFVHDGSNAAPGVSMSLTDGVDSTDVISLYIDFTELNDPPVLITNEIALAEGQTVILSPSNLRGTDEENTDANIAFVLSDIEHGFFALRDFPLAPITSFSMLDVSEGNVQFTHDGSESAPNYRVAVSDGELKTSPETVLVTSFIALDGLPLLQRNQISLHDGENKLLTVNEVLAYDEESPDSDTFFDVTALQHGQFFYATSPDVAVTRFSQQDINDHLLRFLHDGGLVPPTYNLTVQAGSDTLPSSAVSVDFTVLNPPILLLNSLTLGKGDSVVLVPADLSADDLDTPASGLLISVSDVEHGYFSRLINPTEAIGNFTQEEINLARIQFTHDGSDLEPSYKVSVTDGHTTLPPQSAEIYFDSQLEPSPSEPKPEEEPSADPDPESEIDIVLNWFLSPTWKTFAALGGAGALLLSCCCCLLFYTKRRARHVALMDEYYASGATATALASMSSESSVPEQMQALTKRIELKDLDFTGEIGKGGFGVVYKATYLGTTPVAVKTLLCQNLSGNSLSAFREEANLMSGLSSPHIVQFMGVVAESGHFSIVMEYMAKGSLYHTLQDQSADLPWSLRYRISHETAQGLHFLHHHDILHRDLKSLNVLLDMELHAKLSDFGLAKVREETATTTSSATASVGTLAWMAPELLNLGSRASQATDIYALGVILWEIATRSVPYASANGNAGLICQWIKDGQREKIPESTPQKFSALIAKCWAERDGDRPTTAAVIQELATELPNSNGSSPGLVSSYQGNLSSSVQPPESSYANNFSM